MRSEALGASSSAAYASQHRGAGGKIRRPISRKTPSTPYDRPLTQPRRPAAASGGWISKIVDPAYRLLAGGAARFLPSVFSSSSTPSLPAPPPTDDAEEEGACLFPPFLIWLVLGFIKRLNTHFSIDFFVVVVFGIVICILIVLLLEQLR